MKPEFRPAGPCANSRASRTTILSPGRSWASRRAAERPAKPAPTISQSAVTSPSSDRTGKVRRADRLPSRPAGIDRQALDGRALSPDRLVDGAIGDVDPDRLQFGVLVVGEDRLVAPAEARTPCSRRRAWSRRLRRSSSPSPCRRGSRATAGSRCAGCRCRPRPRGRRACRWRARRPPRRVSKVVTERTGPKISSWKSRLSGVTPSTTRRLDEDAACGACRRASALLVVEIGLDLLEVVVADQRADAVLRVERVAHPPLAHVGADALQQRRP